MPPSNSTSPSPFSHLLSLTCYLFIACSLLLVTGCIGRSPSLGNATSSPNTSRSARNKANADEASLEQRVRAYTAYTLAVSADLNDQPDEAMDHYFAAAMAEPTRRDLVVQVIGRLLQARQSDRAIEILLRATSLPNASAELFAWLGFAYATQGNNPNAITANREAVRRDPLLLMAYRNLALLYSESRQPELGLQCLQDAAAQPNADPAFLVSVAELFTGHARANPEHADAARTAAQLSLDRALSFHPSDPHLRQRMADTYRIAGAIDKAESLYLELIEQYPNLHVLREALAELYLRANRKEDAARQFEAIARERPANERATYFLGSLAYEERDFDEAEQLFRRTILLRPDFEPAYFDLVGVLLALDRPADALEILDRARQLFRKSFLLEFFSGVAHARAERYDDAVRHLTEAEVLGATTEPQRLNHLFYFQFGAVSERRGDFVQAEALFRKSLELAPNFPETLNYLGYMWADRGENLEEALQLIEQAVQLEPENAAFLDSLGWVLFKLNRPTEALPWLEKAIEHSDEPDATLFDHIGDVHDALNNLDAARDAWERSLEIADDDNVRRKLEALPTLSIPAP
jgi:tetratricopeptide (TPR) repeat protein